MGNGIVPRGEMFYRRRSLRRGFPFPGKSSPRCAAHAASLRFGWGGRMVRLVFFREAGIPVLFRGGRSSVFIRGGSRKVEKGVFVDPT